MCLLAKIPAILLGIWLVLKEYHFVILFANMNQQVICSWTIYRPSDAFGSRNTNGRVCNKHQTNKYDYAHSQIPFGWSLAYSHYKNPPLLQIHRWFYKSHSPRKQLARAKTPHLDNTTKHILFSPKCNTTNSNIAWQILWWKIPQQIQKQTKGMEAQERYSAHLTSLRYLRERVIL